MSKYEPLGNYLKGQHNTTIAMSFADIERVLKISLPPSKLQRAWWSNNPNNNVMTKQWLDAGYETEQVDLADEKLVFRKRRVQTNLPIDASHSSGVAGALLPPIFGCLKDMIVLEHGYDPAAPTGEDWPSDELGPDKNP
jgi:hypothetical protein